MRDSPTAVLRFCALTDRRLLKGITTMAMNRLTTVVLAAALGCSGVLAAGPAAGTSGPLGCQYRVLWPTAGVYENPNPNSVIVKTKHAGDIVGASTCEGAGYNEYGYVLVATDAAADGRGWMREEAVVQI